MPTRNDIRGDRPDPILSNLVIAHELPGLVGHRQAPVIPVTDSKGKYPVFDRTRRAPQTRRAPRARANETDFSFALRDFDMESHALNFVYADEEVREFRRMGGQVGALEIFNLEREGVLHTERQLQGGREANIAARLRANAIPGEVAAAGAKWSNPDTDLRAYSRRAALSIWQRTRKVMNTVSLPFMANFHAINNNTLRNLLGVGSEQFVTEELIKKAFNVQNVLYANASVDVGMNPDPLAEPVYEDVWGTDVIFSYVDPDAFAGNTSAASRYRESFAYTFRYALLNNEGADIAAIQGQDQSMPVRAWRESDRKSEVRMVEYEEKTHVVSPGCGYVVREAV